MNSHRLLLLLSAACVAAFLGLSSSLAQSKLPDPGLPPEKIPPALRGSWSPLGLPRLRAQVKAGEAQSLASSAYEVDLLEPGADGKAQRAEAVGSQRVLKLESKTEWTRPLKSSGTGPLQVSFLLYGSNLTVISVGNAWLSVVDSPATAGLQIMIGEAGGPEVKWQSARYGVPLDQFDGAPLAPLPVLTVRLDPAAGIWDLYAGPRQVADSIPLSRLAAAPTLTVRAGAHGAWICGVVQSTDNPFAEDANDNGIDDAFERQKNGSLLAVGANLAERQAMAKAWRDYSLIHRSPAWFVEKPLPDRLSGERRNE